MAGLFSKNFNGDTRDTAYRVGLPLFVLNEGEFVTAIGVNHGMVGMAVYSNVVMYDLDEKKGILDISDRQLLGSAGEGNDELYAMSFAFDCTLPDIVGECTTIPLPPGTPMAVLERAYLHPKTLVGPEEAVMIPMELLVYKREPSLLAAWLGALRPTLSLCALGEECESPATDGIPFRIHLEIFLGATIDSLSAPPGTMMLTLTFAIIFPLAWYRGFK